MSEDKYIIEECRFCGNKTKLDLVASHNISDDIEYFNPEYNEYVEEWVSDTTWLLYKCCVCNEVTVIKTFQDYQMVPNDIVYRSLIYPQLRYLDYHMPEKIYSAYEVALKSKHLDHSLCLLSLRRTLEIICKDKGEDKGALVNKVRNLANRGILPDTLKDASDVVRDLGNSAAHGDDVKFTHRQVIQMIDFIELIIEYIYVLPEKISKIKN